MSKKINQENAELNQSVGEAVTKAGDFFQENKKTIIYASSAVVLIVCAVLAIQNFWLEPLKKEAVAQTFVAEQNYRKDNFEVALNGDGNSLGFAQIIDEYGAKAGKAVYFYAGICELQLGEFQSAIDYLSKYNGKDELIMARATCCIGDAYVGLENFEKGLSNYVKAAKTSDNPLAAAYYLKAGIISEEMGNKEEALKHYNTIKEKYPQTLEGMEIEKYISRVK